MAIMTSIFENVLILLIRSVREPKCIRMNELQLRSVKGLWAELHEFSLCSHLLKNMGLNSPFNLPSSLPTPTCRLCKCLVLLVVREHT